MSTPDMYTKEMKTYVQTNLKKIIYNSCIPNSLKLETIIVFTPMGMDKNCCVLLEQKTTQKDDLIDRVNDPPNTTLSKKKQDMKE